MKKYPPIAVIEITETTITIAIEEVVSLFTIFVIALPEEERDGYFLAKESLISCKDISAVAEVLVSG